MKSLLNILFITCLLTACSKKFSFTRYSLPCETQGIESGDLYLMDNNRFFVQVRQCNRYMPDEATAYGTYLMQNDSAFILNSINKLELPEVIESNPLDSSYRILIADKNLSGALNENLKAVINNTDTIRWLRASMGFMPTNKRSVNTIQLYLPNLNYSTPVYFVKDPAQKIFTFKFNAEWDALITNPSSVFLNNFVLIKRDSLLEGKTNILTRSGIPKFKYVGKQKKRKHKIIHGYIGLSKRTVNYLTE